MPWQMPTGTTMRKLSTILLFSWGAFSNLLIEGEEVRSEVGRLRLQELRNLRKQF